MAKTFEPGLLDPEYLDTSLKGFATVSKGIQAIAVEAGEYTKKSFEAGTAVWEKLSTAKSLEAAIEIQSAYVKSAYESFVAQATKVSEMYADLAKDLYQPYEALFAKAK